MKIILSALLLGKFFAIIFLSATLIIIDTVLLSYGIAKLVNHIYEQNYEHQKIKQRN